jgi:hypothetical protein
MLADPGVRAVNKFRSWHSSCARVQVPFDGGHGLNRSDLRTY